MHTDSNIQLPKVLETLIADGVWPNETEAQESWELVSKEELSKVVPDEYKIIFYTPPFYLVSELIESEKDYWLSEEVKIDQITPERVLVLGDFGLGSDTVFALDYSSCNTNPSVIKLCWNIGWVKISDSFNQFIEDFGFLKNA